ncbi:MAG: ABC transporter substrate-binding protein [Candidatus Acidiferrales bacterium]
MEIQAVVTSLDPAVAAANPQEAAAKSEIDALIYPSRNADGSFAGTPGSGAFRVDSFDPGKRLVLAANNAAPGGRPFVGDIEILMGRAAQDRLVDLELGKTDFAEIPCEESRMAAGAGIRLSVSQPDELLALVFLAGRPAAQDAHVREALAQSIDRAAIVNFILQKSGETAGGLLPQWASGTAFLFSTAANPAAAKELWLQIPGSPRLVLGYDSGDPLQQSVAERIVVNAREAGMSWTAQPVNSTGGAQASADVDARLMRLRMNSDSARAALANFIEALSPVAEIDSSAIADSGGAEAVYQRERDIVASFQVIPLVHLPQVYGLSPLLRDWKAPGPGESWPLAGVWLEESVP